jgi:tetratricopeptide (TPR) repeat protein
VSQSSTMMQMAHQAQLEGRLDDAERAFRAVLADEPENEEALHRLATVYLGTNRADEAVALLKELLPQARDPAVWVNLGTALRVQGRLQEAIKAFEGAIERDQRRVGAWAGVAQCLKNAGEIDKAERFFLRALELDGRHQEARRGLADLYLNSGRARQSCEIYQSLLAGDELRPGLRLRYAQALAVSGRPDEALTQLDVIPAEAPQADEATRLRVGVLLATGDAEQALASLAARHPEPVQPGLLVLKARCLAALGRKRDAVDALRDALEEDVGHLNSWLQLSSIAPEVLSDQDVRRIQSLAKDSRRSRMLTSDALARVYRARGLHENEWDSLSLVRELRAESVAGAPQRMVSLLNQVPEVGFPSGCDPSPGRAVTEQPPVFLVGISASGTAALGSLLATRFGEHGVKWQGLEPVLEKAFTYLLGTQKPLKEVMEAEVLPALSDSAPDGFGSRVPLYAGPLLSLFAGVLGAMFPGARFIEVARDSDDLLVECLRTPLGRAPAWFGRPGDLLRLCEAAETAHRHWRQVFGGRWLTVRMEDLISMPDEVLDRIAVYLNRPEIGATPFSRGEIPHPEDAGVGAGKLFRDQLNLVKQGERRGFSGSGTTGPALQ